MLTVRRAIRRRRAAGEQQQQRSTAAHSWRTHPNLRLISATDARGVEIDLVDFRVTPHQARSTSRIGRPAVVPVGCTAVADDQHVSNTNTQHHGEEQFQDSPPHRAGRNLVTRDVHGAARQPARTRWCHTAAARRKNSADLSHASARSPFPTSRAARAAQMQSRACWQQIRAWPTGSTLGGAPFCAKGSVTECADRCNQGESNHVRTPVSLMHGSAAVTVPRFAGNCT